MAATSIISSDVCTRLSRRTRRHAVRATPTSYEPPMHSDPAAWHLTAADGPDLNGRSGWTPGTSVHANLHGDTSSYQLERPAYEDYGRARICSVGKGYSRVPPRMRTILVSQRQMISPTSTATSSG